MLVAIEAGHRPIVVYLAAHVVEACQQRPTIAASARASRPPDTRNSAGGRPRRRQGRPSSQKACGRRPDTPSWCPEPSCGIITYEGMVGGQMSDLTRNDRATAGMDIDAGIASRVVAGEADLIAGGMRRPRDDAGCGRSTTGDSCVRVIGNMSERNTPGTRDGMTPNSPRNSTGASGFGSHMSI